MGEKVSFMKRKYELQTVIAILSIIPQIRRISHLPNLL